LSGAPLSGSKARRKRNKAIIAVFLPAIIFLWIVGWVLYWIGHQRKQQEPQAASPKQEDYVSLIPIVLEDPSEIEN
jgi:flagellar basal body-associated protein FliL